MKIFNFILSALFLAGAIFSVSAQADAGVLPGDLSIIFAKSETPERIARLLNLKDLNITLQDLAAMLEHAKRTDIIKSEFALDQGQAYNRVQTRNKSASAFLNDVCLTKLENWKVSAIRIAPFEYGIYGSKKILADYFKSQNNDGMDRVFQVRYVLNPICNGTTLDIGLHLIYNVLPTDQAFASSLSSSRQGFIDDSLANNSAKADADLTSYVKLMSSPQYKTFYAGWMSRLQVLAQARGTTEANSASLGSLFDQAMKETIFYLSTYSSDGDVVDNPKEEDRASTSLNWASANQFVNENYFAAIKNFSSAVTARSNLARVALNVLEGGDSWTLMGLLPVAKFQEAVFMPNDEARARKVFSALFPQELFTYQAVVQSGKLSLKKVSTSGYYSMLEIQGLRDAKLKRAGVSIFDMGLFALTDFYKQTTDSNYELLPAPDKSDSIPFSRLINNSAMVNSSTTACATCHVQPVLQGSGSGPSNFGENIDSAFSLEPQQKVRLMGFGTQNEPTIRSMTLNEVAFDSQKLNDYLNSLGKK